MKSTTCTTSTKRERELSGNEGDVAYTSRHGSHSGPQAHGRPSGTDDADDLGSNDEYLTAFLCDRQDRGEEDEEAGEDGGGGCNKGRDSNEISSLAKIKEEEKKKKKEKKKRAKEEQKAREAEEEAAKADLQTREALRATAALEERMQALRDLGYSDFDSDFDATSRQALWDAGSGNVDTDLNDSSSVLFSSQLIA